MLKNHGFHGIILGMTFGKSIKTCLKKYVVFSGTATRSEFWWFYLFCVLGIFFGHVLDAYFFGLEINVMRSPEFFEITAAIGLLTPQLTVACRRLHDIGKTGWLQLIAFTIIGLIPLIYWCAQPSNTSKNNIFRK